jgi:hypothetical protein
MGKFSSLTIKPSPYTNFIRYSVKCRNISEANNRTVDQEIPCPLINLDSSLFNDRVSGSG